MSESIKVNVVSYGGVKPGQMVVGNTKDGGKTTLFDAASATDGSYMFYRFAGLTSWNVDLPNLTNGSYMFYICTGLTSFDAALPSLTNGDYMFQSCDGLTSFSSALPSLRSGNAMFDHCILSAESVKLVLNSIPDRASAGLSVSKLHIGKRTNFKTDPDVKELLGETGDEITAKTYSFKGWDVIVQN